MRKQDLYKPQTANYPRLATDAFWSDWRNQYRYTGIIDQTMAYIQEVQLLRPELWQRFVAQFRLHSDRDNGWRGEYWGKMMRGGCFVYSYSRDPKLYQALNQTVMDMLALQEPEGRISSYPEELEFDGWDLWSRKYVLLGMQYFMEICEDAKLCDRLTQSMRRQLDYIMARIGAEEGKLPITSASRDWRGMNSCSLLEPVIRLYSITGEERYLDFGTYIVRIGCTDVENLFELAFQDKLYPYQYPVTKAYEMISCFEGLLEYYRVTGEERWRQAVIRFADKLLESDFTVIGGCGCTHELFDHSTVRQANTTNCYISQETCVTVTLMKFCWQLTLLTGKAKYADAFERSLYNAYLGTVNTEKSIEPFLANEHPDWNPEPLPFDSYSPLTTGTRGQRIGGLKQMPDGHYYGCCACIGAAGIGLVPKLQLMAASDGLVMNLYIRGSVRTRTPQGQDLILTTETAYPTDGLVALTLNMAAPETFVLRLRKPAWSPGTVVFVNGRAMGIQEAGYVVLKRLWSPGDRVEFCLDMRTRVQWPIPYGQDVLMKKVITHLNYTVPEYDREDPLACKHLALLRGPLVLAQESRLGQHPAQPVEIRVNPEGYVEARSPTEDLAPYPHLVELVIPLADGGCMRVTDYASAGKLWTPENRMAAWILVK